MENEGNLTCSDEEVIILPLLSLYFTLKVNLTNRTYQYLALLLALLLLITSVGFSIDVHLYQGKLVSFNFLGKAKSCQEIFETAQLHKCAHFKKNITQNKQCSSKKGTCKNKTLHFQLEQDQQIQITDLMVHQSFKVFIKAYIAAFFLDNTNRDTPVLAHYKPPLITRDILILVESFLL